MKGNIVAVTSDGKNIITAVSDSPSRDRTTINIYNSSTFELEHSFTTAVYYRGISSYNESKNEIAIVYNVGDRAHLKILDINGKILKTIETTIYFNISGIIYFDNGYINLYKTATDGESFIVDINYTNNLIRSFGNYGNHNRYTIPLYGDLFLTRESIINIKTQTIIADLTNNMASSRDQIYKILPDKKWGISESKIYDVSPLFRKVTNIELSMPVFIEVNETKMITATAIFDDNTRQILKSEEYEITTSNFRTLYIDNEEKYFWARDLGKATVAVEYFGFTLEKEIQIVPPPETRTITAAFGATKYILNGEPFDEPTMVWNGVAYLPAAYLARKLGLTSIWDAATNITTLTSGGTPINPDVSGITPGTKTISVTIGATKYILDGEPFDERTMVYNGVAYLPAAYLAQKLGFTTSWDSVTNTTTVTSK